MALDLEKAFTFVKYDKDWKKKIAIGGAILILPTFFNLLLQSGQTLAKKLPPELFLQFAAVLLFLGFLSLVLTIFTTGYSIIMGNNFINTDESQLPMWDDVIEKLLAGIKYFAGYFLFYLPFILLAIILGSITAMTMKTNAAAALISLALIFIMALLMFLLSPLMVSNFLKDLKISSFINFPEAFELVKNNSANFWLLILFNLVIGVLYGIISVLLGITIIGFLVLPFFAFYFALVYAQLAAQFVNSKKQLR